MEIVKVLSIDPSLRNTGLSIITYNNTLNVLDKNAYKISHCQVLVNPAKYTGTEAILNMIDLMNQEAKKLHYQDVEAVIVESPPVMFNKSWSGGAIASIAHISGAAVATFGVEKSYLFRPTEWNRSRKKEVTHNQTIDFLGNSDSWHYEKRIKSEKLMEHILDAVSMGLWWIKSNYQVE